VQNSQSLYLFTFNALIFIHEYIYSYTATTFIFNKYINIHLRRLERVFCCYSGCETMEDYKEGHLMVWANYMSPCNSIAGLYFEGACDVISVTMATHKVHKNVHKISVFVNYLKN